MIHHTTHRTAHPRSHNSGCTVRAYVTAGCTHTPSNRVSMCIERVSIIHPTKGSELNIKIKKGEDIVFAILRKSSSALKKFIISR